MNLQVVSSALLVAEGRALLTTHNVMVVIMLVNIQICYEKTMTRNRR